LLALAGCGEEALTGDPNNGDNSGVGDGSSLPGDTGNDLTNPDLAPELITERPYGFAIPKNYDGSAPLPLIITLHGLGGNGLQQATYSGLLGRVDSDEFFLAYPDGINIGFGVRAWAASCCGATPALVDDVKYLRAVIADIESQYNVDPKHIFVSGHSNGAFMAHLFACQASDKVAAIANLAGTMFKGESSQCQPENPVSVLYGHGTADTTVPFDGGTLNFGGALSVDVISARDLVDHWVQHNACESRSPDEELDLAAALAGNETAVERHRGCRASGTVEFWTIKGGTHIPQLDAISLDKTLQFLFEHPKP